MRAVEEGSLRPSVLGVKEELSNRAASEGPRWTRAVEDQSAPIPEEIASELGGIIFILLRRIPRSLLQG